MKEWKVILATVVIFCTGVVTGGLLVHLTSQKQLRPRPFANAGASPIQTVKDARGLVHEQRYEYMRRLANALELSPDQSGRIDRLLTDSQQRTKSLWEPMQAKLNDEVKKTREQIREVLTPDQRRKFDEMSRQQQRLRKDGRVDGPMARPPGEPPPGFSGPRPGPRGPAGSPPSIPPSPASPDAPK